MRKNLGKKNCELSPDDIKCIVASFAAFEDSAQSRIFDNDHFGYSKVTVERPLRATGIDATRAHNAKEVKALKEEGYRVVLVNSGRSGRVWAEFNPLAGRH